MSTSNSNKPAPTYFEQQRELLLSDISLNLENVLQNINNLNRSLEGIIAVGNEFSQVEGLWSQFENVMAKPSQTATGGGQSQQSTQDQTQQQNGEETK